MDAAEGTPAVGVVAIGDSGEDGAAAMDAVQAAGADGHRLEPEAVGEHDLDVVVAIGESSVYAVARTRPDVTVLPVEAGIGLRSVPLADLSPAVARYDTADWQVEAHPLIDADIDGTAYGPALVDATLVTAKPAHISEFAVDRPTERIGRVRADGVVVATPAGSTGYAGQAGAPIVPPEADVLAIEPIAPFARSPNDWIVPATSVTVVVERDEVAVDVQLDDRTVATIGAHEPVTLSATGSLETVVVPEGVSPFTRRGARLEKH